MINANKYCIECHKRLGDDSRRYCKECLFWLKKNAPKETRIQSGSLIPIIIVGVIGCLLGWRIILWIS